MYSEKATIINAVGLHARPASDFIHKAKEFSSKIKIENLNCPEDGKVNAKSIVGVLSLAVPQGNEVEITATGDDEEEAVKALVAMIKDGFGEEV